MDEMFKKRIEDLKEEFRRGQTQLSELESRAQGLRETLLRISGAIQVLEELASEQSAPTE